MAQPTSPQGPAVHSPGIIFPRGRLSPAEGPKAGWLVFWAEREEAGPGLGLLDVRMLQDRAWPSTQHLDFPPGLLASAEACLPS